MSWVITHDFILGFWIGVSLLFLFELVFYAGYDIGRDYQKKKAVKQND